MFGFLNSAILLAASAALIPLLIHLFSRRKRKVIEFSSLRHLTAMQRRQVRRLQIRQLLLLILRMLIIFSVVLAFARPMTKSSNFGSHAAVAAVILLDNSASMGRQVRDGELFELAKKQTKEILENFDQVDQVALIPLCLSDAFKGSELASPAVALEQLERISVLGQVADLEAAVLSANRLLENSKNLNYEVYIVTDRQRNSLPSREVLSESDARLFLVELPTDEIENHSVSELSFGGQLIQPGQDFDLTVTISNFSVEKADELIASYYLDNRRVALSDFSLDRTGKTALRFSRSVARAGFHSGYVQISDDYFPVDNRRFFSFKIPEQFNVLLIGDDGALPFVKLALTPSAGSKQYWSVKHANPSQLAGVNFTDYDVVMLTGAPDISDAYFRRINRFVRRGGALFVTYGKGVDSSRFNRDYSPLTGVTITEPMRSQFSRAGYFSLKSVDVSHPVFTGFEFDDGKLPLIKFFTLPRTEVDDSAKVVMWFSGDRPALVEVRSGKGKVLTFTAPLSPEYTDFQSKGIFVPFLSRIAEYLASSLSGLDLNIISGSRVTRSVSIKGSIAEPVELTAPNGNRYYIEPSESEGALVVTTPVLSQPGIYKLRFRGREIDRFAVNLDVTESELAALDSRQLATALGEEEPIVLKDGEPLSAQIAEARVGRELWPLFIWIAIILFGLEMFLSRGTTAKE